MYVQGPIKVKMNCKGENGYLTIVMESKSQRKIMFLANSMTFTLKRFPLSPGLPTVLLVGKTKPHREPNILLAEPPGRQTAIC